jgi:NAD(P)-dependent dehydrogenase (short-subunit alcohol dehydrogenase family)
MTRLLEGKIAIITGGASGIERAAALAPAYANPPSSTASTS